MTSRLRPSAAELVDAGFLLVLSAAALSGLASTFTGWGFLVVGLAGVALGIVVVHVSSALRLPVAVPLVTVAALFFLLGGPLCLRGTGAGLPGPRAFDQLGHQVVAGWKDLLTTLPPIDGGGPLLVLPWVAGLAAGTLGALLTRMDRGPAWLRTTLPLLAPTALLAGVILLGLLRPQSLWVQGVGYAVTALAWLALRAWRTSAPVESGRGRGGRLLVGAGMVALAGVLALPVGTWASASDDGRLVLRTYVEPPFDVGQYPSPLAAFRRYVEPDPRTPDPYNLYDETLLTVDGAPAGTRLRIAALDHYDGVVWGAANDTIPGTTDDIFQRVSSTIDNPVEGDELEVTVTVGEGYDSVWLPTIGALQGIAFPGEEQADSFRYNLATRTGVVPDRVGPGDRYRFTTVVPDDSLSVDSQPSTLTSTSAGAAAFLDTQAVQWSAGESLPLRRLFAIADHLKGEGKYSDGVVPAEQIYHPGHHVQRLGDGFVNDVIMAGNDEQYAATMALLAGRIPLPARVVLGAVVPEDGVIEGKDMQAWVEVQVADGSWRTLPTDTFMDYDKPAKRPPQPQQKMSGTVVPPPAPIPPPSTAGEQTDAELRARKGDRDPDDDGFSLPGWLRALGVYVGLPLLALLALAGAVIGAKALRRRRRRTHVVVSRRLVGAWRELVDHARDLGATGPLAGTRREQGLLLATAGATAEAPGLARRADQHVFGPVPPDDETAAAYWTAIDEERRAMSESVSRRRRWLAAVNPASLRR